MMEKYAVDQSMIPPTDDQLITIKKLNGILQKEASEVRTADEADKLIKELEKEADYGKVVNNSFAEKAIQKLGK